MPLLSKAEIADIFSSSYFYENKCIYIIDKITKTYQTDKNYNSLLDYADSIRQAYLTGHTIIVKNLEKFNSDIVKKCAELGVDVDVHMYLVPQNGASSFEYHFDDRDVWVYMVYGEKEFYVRQLSGEKATYLKMGESLFIPKGDEHKAIPHGASCLLSFGISSGVVDYKIPVGINMLDLETSLKGV